MRLCGHQIPNTEFYKHWFSSQNGATRDKGAASEAQGTEPRPLLFY